MTNSMIAHTMKSKLILTGTFLLAGNLVTNGLEYSVESTFPSVGFGSHTFNLPLYTGDPACTLEKVKVDVTLGYEAFLAVFNFDFDPLFNYSASLTVTPYLQALGNFQSGPGFTLTVDNNSHGPISPFGNVFGTIDGTELLDPFCFSDPFQLNEFLSGTPQLLLNLPQSVDVSFPFPSIGLGGTWTPTVKTTFYYRCIPDSGTGTFSFLAAGIAAITLVRFRSRR